MNAEEETATSLSQWNTLPQPHQKPLSPDTLVRMQAKADSCTACHGTRICHECDGDGADHEENPDYHPFAIGHAGHRSKIGLNLTPGLCYLCNGYRACTACRHLHPDENNYKILGRD